MSGRKFRCRVTNCGGGTAAVSEPRRFLFSRLREDHARRSFCRTARSTLQLVVTACSGFLKAQRPAHAGMQIRPPGPHGRGWTWIGAGTLGNGRAKGSSPRRVRRKERCGGSVRMQHRSWADATFTRALTGAGQRGVHGAYELNNIGLLVQAWGRVTFSGAGVFYLDDGSMLQDGSGHPGVRIVAPGLLLPEAGALVRATGVMSCYGNGGARQRLVRPRTQADIEVLHSAAGSGG